MTSMLCRRASIGARSGEIIGATHRDVRESAIEAANFLQQRTPGAKVEIIDLRERATVRF